MSQYDDLDRLILVAIERRKSPLYERDCYAESRRLAQATGRETFRIIDGRIQALRSAGKIRHFCKRERPDGVAGWYLSEPACAPSSESPPVARS
jgi:hypothetical protein